MQPAPSTAHPSCPEGRASAVKPTAAWASHALSPVALHSSSGKSWAHDGVTLALRAGALCQERWIDRRAAREWGLGERCCAAGPADAYEQGRHSWQQLGRQLSLSEESFNLCSTCQSAKQA